MEYNTWKIHSSFVGAGDQNSIGSTEWQPNIESGPSIRPNSLEHIAVGLPASKFVLHRRKKGNKTPPFLLTFTSSFTTTTPTGTGAADNDSSQPGRPSSPPPIQVGFTDSAGRGVFATRRITAGELIHTGKPIVCHPSLSSLHSVCYFCLRKLLPNQQPLFQSNDVQFCSQECQNLSQVFHEIERRADWSTFNDYCRMHGLKYPLLVKRFACLVISGSSSASNLDILQPASLSSAMISLVEKEFCLLRNTFQDADINTQQLASASVEAEGAVGNAVYMLPSFYNHDCDPNAHILWAENVDARVKALCDIEAGEELRICYIDASMDYEARQTILSKGFGFQCNCPRCSSRH